MKGMLYLSLVMNKAYIIAAAIVFFIIINLLFFILMFLRIYKKSIKNPM